MGGGGGEENAELWNTHSWREGGKGCGGGTLEKEDGFHPKHPRKRMGKREYPIEKNKTKHY